MPRGLLERYRGWWGSLETQYMACCKNLGSVDRSLRAVIGIVALAIAFTSLGALDGRPWAILVAAVGLVMLLTSVMGMCPLYVPLGLSTCRTASK